MKALVIVVASCIMSGCAGDMVINVQQAGQQQREPLVKVTVNDLRTPGVAASKREAAFGVPMGNITFDPPEAEIVKRLLEEKLSENLSKNGVGTGQEYSCDIKEFGVNTNTTPLYWDVIGRVNLVLTDRNGAHKLVGGHTKRTYVWPSEAIVKEVIDKSLKQIGSELDKVLSGM